MNVTVTEDAPGDKKMIIKLEEERCCLKVCRDKKVVKSER